MSSLYKKYLVSFLLGIIVFLAVVLRFYQLGENPPSLDWDEASLGYNAYSILKTGRDEYGTFLPTSIRSFEDYKPPLYVYLTVPFVALFDLNELTVRLPSAILGSIAVVVSFFLVKEFLYGMTSSPKYHREKSYYFILNTIQAFANKEYMRDAFTLLATFFFAISPWGLQFSRSAFEGNIGLTFLLLGTVFFLKGLRNPKFFFLSAISYALCLYSYHSFRLVVPVFLFLLAILFYKKLWQAKKIALSAFLFLCLTISPIFLSTLDPSGTGARLSMVTIFTQDTLTKSIQRIELDQKNKDVFGSIFHNRRIVYAQQVVKGYLDHFNPDFLFLHGDGGRQHHAVEMGMLYFFELPFIIIGFCLLLFLLNKRIAVLFILFFISPIASAITTGTPHPVRAIAMIPALHIFSAAGILYFVFLILSFRNIFLRYGFLIIMALMLLFNVLYYLHQYYVHMPIEYGDFWQYGYKEALLKAKQLESRYDKIIMTYEYDQPYIYYLFYNKIDPVWYQKNWDVTGSGKTERMVRDIGKYTFRDIEWEKDKDLKKTLLIGTPKEIPDNAGNILSEVRFLDNTTAFRIVGL